MSRFTILSSLFFIIAISACNQAPTQRKTYIPIDTTTSFKIENYWVTPKKSFEFVSLLRFSGDTLHLVTCSDYVYFPFGKLTDKSSISASLLKDFIVINFKRDTFTNQNINPPFFEWSETVELQFAGNQLKLFLDNDPEASKHGYILCGQIINSKAVLSGNIKVGMNIENFFKTFFDRFPIELIKKYKVVEFESCVEDATHIYLFANGKLSSVNFISAGCNR